MMLLHREKGRANYDDGDEGNLSATDRSGRRLHYIDRNGRRRSSLMADRKHIHANRIVIAVIAIVVLVAVVKAGMSCLERIKSNRIKIEQPVAVKRTELQTSLIEQQELLEQIDLASYKNPFLGDWQARQSGSTTKTIYHYESDAQFTYEMNTFISPDNQQGQGGYLLYGNHLITWREDEGVRAYYYEVVDNSTISVTRLVTNAAGEATMDSPIIYTRVAGSEIVMEDSFMPSVGDLVGQWTFDYDAEVTVTFTCEEDGGLHYTLAGASAGPGGRVSGCYLIYEDRLAAWFDDMGTMVYRFEMDDADTIRLIQLKRSALGTYEDGATFLCKRIEE